MTHRCLMSLPFCLAFVLSPAKADDPKIAGPDVTIVVLGDSITKGVRPGVKPEETFAAIAERELKVKGIPARVINLGIGGERTDQAIRRLDAVAADRPRVVTVMYGTNDSYVDRGADRSRLSVSDYRENLKKIVADMRRRRVAPILMTEPRWAADASPNGLGENPNVRLTLYMAACREVAAELDVPIVDHFARWTKAETKGQSLRDWTTDGCHPNPQGHRQLADALLPVLIAAAEKSRVKNV